MLIALFYTPLATSQVKEIDKSLTPLSMSAEAVRNDNFNPTSSEEISANGVVLKGEGHLVTMAEGHAFVIDYQASYQAMKVADNELNFDTNQKFFNFGAGFFSRFYLSDAWQLDTDLRQTNQEQKYGEGISRFKQDVLFNDKVKRSDGSVTLIYGRDTDTRFISFNLGLHTDRFTDANEYARLFDLNQIKSEFNFAYRRNTNTSFLLRINASDDDYEDEQRLDSRGVRALLGMDWKPSGKSSLELFLGMYWRNVQGGSKTNGLAWVFDYTGTPRQDWLVKLNSARYSDVSDNENSADSLKQNFDLELYYFYSQQWRLGFKLATSNVEFDKIEGPQDIDDTSGTLTISLMPNEHSSINIEWAFVDVSSSDDSVDYTQNEVRLRWQYAF